MADYKDVLLLVSLFDDEEQVGPEKITNIDRFNRWLKEEYPGSRPHFLETEIAGVFTAHIRQCNVEELVAKFREIKWWEEQTAVLMVRGDDSTQSWETTTYLVKPN